MPDEMEDLNEVSPYAQGFQDWLIAFTAEMEKEGPDVVDLTIIVMNCVAKMRGVLLKDEVAQAMLNVVTYVEEHINDSSVILAEHWRDLEDGYELYAEANTAVAPDDLSGLTNALPDDYDLRD